MLKLTINQFNKWLIKQSMNMYDLNEPVYLLYAQANIHLLIMSQVMTRSFTMH